MLPGTTILTAKHCTWSRIRLFGRSIANLLELLFIRLVSQYPSSTWLELALQVGDAPLLDPLDDGADVAALHQLAARHLEAEDR